MTRQEYVNSYISCSTREERKKIHQEYYLGLARQKGIILSDELKEIASKSKDPFFNDSPIKIWDLYAIGLKTYQKIDLFEGVCILKALAEEERQKLGVFIQ